MYALIPRIGTTTVVLTFTATSIHLLYADCQRVKGEG